MFGLNVRKCLLLFGLLLANLSQACLNGSMPEAGYYEYPDLPTQNDVADKDYIAHYNEMAQDSLTRWKKSHDVSDRLDYAVALVYLKRLDEAKKVLLEIEAQKPNSYQTAANLGTTYELLGDNPVALKYISKAVKINPEAHNGSEWLHVNVLKIKTAGTAVTGRTLLGHDFGAADVPASSLSLEQLRELRDQIYAQLHERMKFVHPTDAIVAQLLFELGNIEWLVELKNEAGGNQLSPYAANTVKNFYAQARLYGIDNQLLSTREDFLPFSATIAVQKLIDFMGELVRKPILLGILLVLLAFLSYLAYLIFGFLLRRLRAKKSISK